MCWLGDLTLGKLTPSISPAELKESLRLGHAQLFASCVELDPLDNLAEHFLSPNSKFVQLIVQLPQRSIWVILWSWLAALLVRGFLSMPANLSCEYSLISLYLPQAEMMLPYFSVAAPYFTNVSCCLISHTTAPFPPEDKMRLERLQRLHTYFWGKDRVNIISKAGRIYSTLDLTFFKNIRLNTCSFDFLLIRDEYMLIYEAILKKTNAAPSTAFLITGQPGIGASNERPCRHWLTSFNRKNLIHSICFGSSTPRATTCRSPDKPR